MTHIGFSQTPTILNGIQSPAGHLPGPRGSYSIHYEDGIRRPFTIIAKQAVRV
jgi:hypothetical protein